MMYEDNLYGDINNDVKMEKSSTEKHLLHQDVSSQLEFDHHLSNNRVTDNTHCSSLAVIDKSKRD